MPDHFNIHRDMRHSLFYYKNIQKVLDARATRKANLLLRKRMLFYVFLFGFGQVVDRRATT